MKTSRFTFRGGVGNEVVIQGSRMERSMDGSATTSSMTLEHVLTRAGQSGPLVPDGPVRAMSCVAVGRH